MEVCRQRGVLVCNCAGYSTTAVAELVFGLVLGLARRIPACDGAARHGGTKAGLVGFELAGKTFGIVGTGAIGTKTAQLFLAFGAKVIAYSRTVRPEVEAMGVEYTTLEDVMSRSDIVSIHTPNNAETKGMISKELIAKMRPDAILINVARGAIVDNAALADALNQDKLAGAGIDVFDMEPPIPADYPLLHAKNTVLTPHVAFATDESMLRRAEIVFQNVEAYLNGQPENICKL